MRLKILFCFILLAPGWLCAQDTFLRRQNHAMPIVENSSIFMSRFGSSIAVDGDYAVVGAPAHPGDIFPRVGRVFVYRRSGFQWAHVATLKPQEESASLNFGTSVAISGNIIVVGAPNAFNPLTENNSGGAYFFREGVTGWPATESFRFLPSDGSAHTQFAANLVIGNVNGVVAVFASAHMAVANIDAETTLADQGKVYEFRLPNPNAKTPAFVTEHHIWQSTPFRNGNTKGALFGRHIAINGNILAVGATTEAVPEDNGPIRSGAVYLYDITNPEQEPFMLNSPTNDPSAQFGFRIALESNRMLVSSIGEQNNAGAAYYYTREEDGPWQLVTRFTADRQQENSNFGNFLMFTPRRAVISAPRMDHDFEGEFVQTAGITYVFDLERSNFTAQTTPGEADQLLFDNFAWPNVNKSSIFGINGAYHPASSSLLIASQMGGDNNNGGLHVFQPAFPPTFNGFGESFQNLSLIPDAPFSLSIPENTFAITNGNQLHYTVSMSKEGAEGEINWLRFSSENLLFSGTPGIADRGNYTVQVVTQTDQVGPTTTGTFSLSVTNRAPVRNAAITDQEVEAGKPLTFSMDIFSDADEDPLTYTFMVVDLGDNEDGETGRLMLKSEGTHGLPSWLIFDAENLTLSGTPTLDHLGTSRLRILASDGNGGQASFSFEIRVILPNNAPIVNRTISTQAAFIGQFFTFTFDEDVFFDLDGDDLRFNLIANWEGNFPIWLNFDPWSRTLSGTPPIGTEKMEYPFLLTATDGRASVSTPLTIVVPNRPPILKKAIPNLRLMVSTAFVSLTDFNNYFAELDGDGMTLTISREGGGNLPNWLMLSNNTLVAAGAVDAGAFGVVVNATDNTGLSTSETFQFSVVENNTNPRTNNAVALQNFTVRAGDGFSYSLPLDAFIDDDGDALTYSFQFLNQFGSLIPKPWWMEVDPSVPSVSGTPVAGVKGTYTVLVIASDGLGTISRSFVVTVANSAPQVVGTLPNYRTINGFLFTLSNLLGYFNDPDGDMLSIELNFPDIECPDPNCAPDWAGVSQNWNYELIMRPNDVSLIGKTFLVNIVASDGQATATLPFQITVIGSNVSPFVAKEITGDEGKVFNIRAGETFNFTLPNDLFEDPDQDVLFFSAPGRPSWLDFDPATRTFNGTPEANQRGDYSIVVIASDGNADASTDFEIRVGNNAPVVANPIPAQNAPVGDFFRFTIPANTFTDPDGDGLEIYAHDSEVVPENEEGLSLPVWLRFNERTLVMSGTPALSHRGTYPITLFAFDQFDGTMVSHTFQVVVPNRVPVATQGLVTSLTGRADEPFSFTLSENAFSDPEGDAITLSVTGLPSWLTFNASTLTLSGTPGRTHVGSQTITLVATDALQGSASVNITIVVEAPLSAADEQLRASITVFPNPANGTVNLEMDHAYRGSVEIRLMEVSGKVIRSVNMEKHQQSFSHQLDTRELPAGVFLLQVMTRQAAATHRLVIVE